MGEVGVAVVGLCREDDSWGSLHKNEPIALCVLDRVMHSVVFKM